MSENNIFDKKHEEPINKLADFEDTVRKILPVKLPKKEVTTKQDGGSDNEQTR